MYTLEEKLDQHKQIWLTRENYKYLKNQKTINKKKGVKISMAKLLNNLIQKEKNDRPTIKEIEETAPRYYQDNQRIFEKNTAESAVSRI